MKIFKQLALIFGVCVTGDVLSACMGHFLPGNVLGMVLLLVLLISGALKEDTLRETAGFFEQNMPFFFLPAGMGILELSAEVRAVLLPIVAVVVLSSLLTGVVTAGTVQLVSRLERKRTGAQG